MIIILTVIILNLAGNVLAGPCHEAYKEENINKKIELYKKSLEIHDYCTGSRSGNLNNLSVAYQKIGNYSEAHKAIDEALQLEPNSYFWAMRKAGIYRSQGLLGKCIEWFENALSWGDDDDRDMNAVYLSYATFLLTANDKNYRNVAKALSYALKAFESSEKVKHLKYAHDLTKSNYALLVLGNAYLANGMKERALSSHLKAVNVNGNQKTEILKHYQRELKRLGYYSGEVDGEYNDEISKAIEQCVYSGVMINTTVP